MNKYSLKMIKLMEGKDFIIMIVILVLLLLLPSFFFNERDQLLVFNIILTFFFILGTNCLIGSSKLFGQTLLISIIAISLTWLGYFKSMSMHLSLLSQIAYFSFFFIQLFHILDVLFNRKEITANLIFGALNGYILLGFMGSCLMLFINTIYPESYAYNDGHLEGFYDFIYFSFINLMTVGFGDILPHSPPAKAITVIHTLFGQMYLTVIVAMIVGTYLSNDEKK